MRKAAAEGISAVSTVALKHIFHRPAANFPGKIALYADPHIIEDMAPKLRQGSICVVGTNGKTTVTNMLADALERDGLSVVCNRTGANLDSGIATSLLHAPVADWGVFESDELWLVKSLPQLQSRYVLLLNLFRDQLDRCGEIDRIQHSIVDAIKRSPQTVLIYNGDDPLCEAIARAIPNTCIPFGIAEDIGLEQNTVSDARMCQECEHMLEYRYRLYGQLGDFYCPACDFKRAPLRFAACGCHVDHQGLAFDVTEGDDCAALSNSEDDDCTASTMQTKGVGGANDPSSLAVGDSAHIAHITAPYSGVYMLYNLLAVFTAGHLMGATVDAMQHTFDAFHPDNGRLQHLQVNGRSVLLNLAKNPTGFNQNLSLVLQDHHRKAVVFYINDREADGHDISWIWDVDFEELASQSDIVAYAGGLRADDVRVRLRYAGLDAQTVEDADDAMARIATLPDDYHVYMIANYTALPSVRTQLMHHDEGTDNVSADTSNQGNATDQVSAKANNVSEAISPSISANVNTNESMSSNAPTLQSMSNQGKQQLVDANTNADANWASVQAACAHRPLRIVHLFPDLLNLYGDGGNIRVLSQRCTWRGITSEIVKVEYGQTVDLSTADIVMMGGGPDREQKLASEELERLRDGLRSYVEDDGVLLAICGGFQILGSHWLTSDQSIEGLGILDIDTRRVQGPRIIDNIVLDSSLASHPIVGYENHAGRTFLGKGVQPFGKLISRVGHGNNDTDRSDGALYRKVIGTYSHGPLLSKNPEVADWMITHALARRLKMPVELPQLDDSAEFAANEYMCHRLGVRRTASDVKADSGSNNSL